MTPVVSVVMPVRDAAPFLDDAVESVLAQTVRELELVAVDDGSTDGSSGALQEHARRDPRVRILAGAASGLTDALRAGCAAARAPYVARMDADDVALPDRLERQLAALEADPGLGAVGGAVVMIDRLGRRGALVRYPVDDGAIRRRLLRSNPFAHPAVTMRRAAYEAVGGYRLANGEDYDLWLRLAERYRLANLAAPVLLYRHHASQYSVSRIDDQAVGVLAAQYAARRRAAGAADPIPADGSLGPATLAAVGLTPEVVEAGRALHRLRWAALLEQLGELDAARALFAAAGAGGARRAVARAQAAAALRRPAAVAGALARGLAAHPVALPRELVRAFRSRRSFEAAA